MIDSFDVNQSPSHQVLLLPLIAYLSVPTALFLILSRVTGLSQCSPLYHLHTPSFSFVQSWLALPLSCSDMFSGSLALGRELQFPSLGIWPPLLWMQACPPSTIPALCTALSQLLLLQDHMHFIPACLFPCTSFPCHAHGKPSKILQLVCKKLIILPTLFSLNPHNVNVQFLSYWWGS